MTPSFQPHQDVHTAEPLPPPVDRLPLSPLRISVGYLVLGISWIILSDTLLSGGMTEETGFTLVSMIKGSSFVLLSALLLYLVITRSTGQLQYSYDLFHTALQLFPDAVTIIRRKDGGILYVNHGFTRLTGHSQADVAGRTIQELKLWNQPAELTRFLALLTKQATVRDLEAVFCRRDGSELTTLLAAHEIRFNNEQCIITMAQDVSAIRRANREIEQLAHFDPVTGLPNQQLLYDRLQQLLALAEREARSVALLYISLVRFDQLVETFGHGRSDEAIRRIFERLRASLREGDTLARIYKDECVVLLPNDAADITSVTQKLLDVLTMPVALGDQEALSAACIGIACYPADGGTAESLLHNAHLAMNQARLRGENSFQCFSTGLQQRVDERNLLGAGLLRGLERNEFFLCYQPIFQSHEQCLVGMEALVRWQHPTLGLVGPDAFIPVAEDTGLIVQLGAWVLQQACRQTAQWRRESGLPLRVSVNVSARQIQEDSFFPLVMQILAEQGLPQGSLQCECTERLMLDSTPTTLEKLQQLRRSGVLIAIDDFGTGYSSLSLLKHLPVDTLKIDRCFIRDIPGDDDDMAIVDAIIALAAALRLRVTAEGIETEEQLQHLRARSCHELQGYLLGRPLTVEAFGALLQGRSTLEDTAPTSPLPITPADLRELHVKTPLPVAPAGEHVREIMVWIDPIEPGDRLTTALQRFQTDRELHVLPVVQEGRVVGILNRVTFIEEQVIGRHGYGFHINHAKKIRDLMSPVGLLLEADQRIEEAALEVLRLTGALKADNICAVRQGIYIGVLDVNLFVGAITAINLVLAKGANPLTGLPGNEGIQREITRRLESGRDFDISYIDIDNFKPFNDNYGFQRGDQVIKSLGELCEQLAQTAPDRQRFAGHIGGDDFILISEPGSGKKCAEQLIRDFTAQLPAFHGDDDVATGWYSAVSRRGEPERFPLLAISIGIVATAECPVGSYAQLASLATEVKKAAKGIAGSSVAINRRKPCSAQPEQTNKETS